MAQVELGLDSLPDSINMGNRYLFEDIKTIPQDWRRDLLNLVLGSHDSVLQEKVNRFRPVQVFNLSITPPNIIEETHERMSSSYHVDGGRWERRMMPRTVMVFVNDEEGGEGDTLAVERERDLALSAHAQAAVDEIDQALERLKAGTYGICLVSGKSIPKERLRAIPWAAERVEFKTGGFLRR